MQELKITMLGASGVGKTTLLTAMYEVVAKNKIKIIVGWKLKITNIILKLLTFYYNRWIIY